MDGLAIHPYGDSSSQAPILSAHPRTTAVGLADYGKLVRLLGEAFDGTAQRGTTLPILYDEFGVESRIPAAKARLYTGAEPTTTRPVDEPTQGEYYRQALELAFCQPNVRGLILFHLADEPALAGWQSGIYYVDGKAKRSLREVAAADARDEARRGRLLPRPQARPRRAQGALAPRDGARGRQDAARLPRAVHARLRLPGPPRAGGRRAPSARAARDGHRRDPLPRAAAAAVPSSPARTCSA